MTPSTGDTRGCQYRHVRVLLMHWENEEYFRNELNNLSMVFRQRYGYDCQIVPIPVRSRKPDATESAGQILDNFVQSSPNGVRELLIVVYGGHGERVQAGLRWRAEQGPHYLDWNSLQERRLFAANKDTLVILDCCNAGAADRQYLTSCRDILAACASDRTTPRDRAGGSFTAFLTNALWTFSTAFTIQQLVDAIEKLGPRERPVYTTRPGDPPHRIFLEPKRDGGQLGSTKAYGQRASDVEHQPQLRRKQSDPGEYIEIIIRLGPYVIRIRIYIRRKTLLASALQGLGVQAEDVITRAPDDTDSVRSGGRYGPYSVVGKEFFKPGRRFAIPWSSENAKQGAATRSKQPSGVELSERQFIVMASDQQFCSAIEVPSTPTVQVDSSKIHSLMFNLPVKDLGCHTPDQVETMKKRLISSTRSASGQSAAKLNSEQAALYTMLQKKGYTREQAAELVRHRSVGTNVRAVGPDSSSDDDDDDDDDDNDDDDDSDDE